LEHFREWKEIKFHEWITMTETKHELNMANKGSKEWAFCILSDAQEELLKGRNQEANDLINKAKKVLDGQYKSDGFSIEVE